MSAHPACTPTQCCKAKLLRAPAGKEFTAHRTHLQGAGRTPVRQRGIRGVRTLRHSMRAQLPRLLPQLEALTKSFCTHLACTCNATSQSDAGLFRTRPRSAARNCACSDGAIASCAVLYGPCKSQLSVTHALRSALRCTAAGTAHERWRLRGCGGGATSGSVQIWRSSSVLTLR